MSLKHSGTCSHSLYFEAFWEGAAKWSNEQTHLPPFLPPNTPKATPPNTLSGAFQGSHQGTNYSEAFSRRQIADGVKPCGGSGELRIKPQLQGMGIDFCRSKNIKTSPLALCGCHSCRLLGFFFFSPFQDHGRWEDCTSS